MKKTASLSTLLLIISLLSGTLCLSSASSSSSSSAAAAAAVVATVQHPKVKYCCKSCFQIFDTEDKWRLHAGNHELLPAQLRSVEAINLAKHGPIVIKPK